MYMYTYLLSVFISSQPFFLILTYAAYLCHWLKKWLAELVSELCWDVWNLVAKVELIIFCRANIFPFSFFLFFFGFLFNSKSARLRKYLNWSGRKKSKAIVWVYLSVHICATEKIEISVETRLISVAKTHTHTLTKKLSQSILLYDYKLTNIYTHTDIYTPQIHT